MQNLLDKVQLCERCHKIYEAVGGREICPACAAVEDRYYAYVKKYIKNNKKADLEQIAEECHVAVDLVVGWVKEGKIRLTRESGAYVICEECGKHILTGQYCPECKTKKVRAFELVYSQLEVSKKRELSSERKGARMRYLNRA